jgi:hypothetical protein
MIAKNLTIISLVLGGLGATLFVIYKARGASKRSLIANGSKLLIALGIILLAVAVLLLSEDKEPYSGTPFQDDEYTKTIKVPSSTSQPVLTEITGLEKNRLYSLNTNEDVLFIFKSDENGSVSISHLFCGGNGYKQFGGFPLPAHQVTRIESRESPQRKIPEGVNVTLRQLTPKKMDKIKGSAGELNLNSIYFDQKSGKEAGKRCVSLHPQFWGEKVWAMGDKK